MGKREMVMASTMTNIFAVGEEDGEMLASYFSIDTCCTIEQTLSLVKELNSIYRR
jgi:hypothetical protein